MSATQSAHHPLMCRYYREADHSRKELAKRYGVSHSRIYVARAVRSFEQRGEDKSRDDPDP